MYESMIPKTDKKSGKKVQLEIERIKSKGQTKRKLSLRILYHPHSMSFWP